MLVVLQLLQGAALGAGVVPALLGLLARVQVLVLALLPVPVPVLGLLGAEARSALSSGCGGSSWAR